MAELVAMTIVRCHLATMGRIGVRYDLLPRESDILHLKFWDHAFEQLKATKRDLLRDRRQEHGCWVMRIDTEGYEDDKIIVRSNGTVTYVGKDIAYQLWKFGLLDQDFHYRHAGSRHARRLGHDVVCRRSRSIRRSVTGIRVYNVIDVRQSYLQNVVRRDCWALATKSRSQFRSLPL